MKLNVKRTTIIPSCPELCTEAPNHCLDLSSIMVPEALLFPANKIELKVKSLLETSGLDTVQDFLIKLGMKPRLHILKISIFFTKSSHCQTYQNYEHLLKVS